MGGVGSNDLALDRLGETSTLALTFSGQSPDRAWREASYRLFFRWLDRRGKENLEGQERAPEPVEAPIGCYGDERARCLGQQVPH